ALQLIFARIGCGSDQDVTPDFSLQVESDPSLLVDLVELTVANILDADIARLLADCRLRQGNIEPLAGRNIDVAAEIEPACLHGPVDGNIHHVIAGRQDSLHNEGAIVIHRDGLVKNGDAISDRHVLAVYGDRAAVQRDIPEG